MSDEKQAILLISSDNKNFKVLRKHALISNFVCETLDNSNVSGAAGVTGVVTVPEVTGDILGLVVRYMQHHAGNDPPVLPRPLSSKDMTKVCKQKRDAKFIIDVSKSREKLYALILAAHVMQVLLLFLFLLFSHGP